MNIKAIIMDADGTLLTSDKTIAPETKKALLAAQRRGIKLVLASGRPTSGLLKYEEELLMDKNQGLLISYNGGQAVDCETRKTIFNQTIPIAEGKAVLEHMKNFKVLPMIDRGEYMYVNNVYDNTINFYGEDFNVLEYEARSGNYLLCEKRDLAAFLDFEVNKILTAGDPDYLQKHYQEMMKPFKKSLNAMFTAPFYFEFTAKNIDKANALKVALKNLGYAREELIAFGDGMNDIAMLQYVGTGVAMGNAEREVKANASYIAASNDDDGIAKALYHFMPELAE